MSNLGANLTFDSDVDQDTCLVRVLIDALYKMVAVHGRDHNRFNVYLNQELIGHFSNS